MSSFVKQRSARQAWFYKQDIKLKTKITFYPKRGRKTYLLSEVIACLEWLESQGYEGGKELER